MTTLTITDYIEARRAEVDAALAGILPSPPDCPSPVAEAMECDRQFLIRYEKDHPRPNEQWSKGASAEMSGRLDEVGVIPGPCGQNVTLRPAC